MDGEVAHGVELDIARDDANLGAVHVEREDGAPEMAGLNLLGNRLGLQRDVLRLLRVAINDAGNAPFAADLARATLAGALPGPCLEFDGLSHVSLRLK